MADYPESYIKTADATATKEAGPLLGMIALDMVATVVAIYIAGEIVNALIK